MLLGPLFLNQLQGGEPFLTIWQELLDYWERITYNRPTQRSFKGFPDPGKSAGAGLPVRGPKLPVLKNVYVSTVAYVTIGHSTRPASGVSQYGLRI
jgi:hypothetical protein